MTITVNLVILTTALVWKESVLWAVNVLFGERSTRQQHLCNCWLLTMYFHGLIFHLFYDKWRLYSLGKLSFKLKKHCVWFMAQFKHDKKRICFSPFTTSFSEIRHHGFGWSYSFKSRCSVWADFIIWFQFIADTVYHISVNVDKVKEITVQRYAW